MILPFLSLLLPATGFPSGTSVNQYMLTGLTCPQAKVVVAKEGAVIFHYGNDYFAKVVRNVTFCDREEAVEPFHAVVPATGTDCYMGFTCVTRPTGGP